MLDAALPLLFLAALALAHFLYFRLASATPVQQSVRVADFPSSGPAPALVRSPLPAARPSRYRRALVLGNAFYDQPLICGCSLTINGVALFKGAVKVSGDLLIVGRAEFTRPVVANGKVVVLGQAIFRQGLLARTPRGRIATPAAWAHLGVAQPPSSPMAGTLFEVDDDADRPE